VTEPRRRSTLDTVATLGLAIGAPLALLSGLAAVATTPRGIPAGVGVVFLISCAVTVMSAALYLSLGLRKP
jgi:hypothetical protein